MARPSAAGAVAAPRLEAGLRPTHAVKTNYVLIDYESVQPTALERLTPDHFHLYVFVGPTQRSFTRDITLKVQAKGERGVYVETSRPGPNALDFHIAYYLGVLATQEPAGFFHIISKDTGFDPLIEHLKVKKIFCARSESIEAMPCFQPANGTSAGEPKGAEDLESLVKLVTDDLVKRKASKPRKVATLRSTVQARLGPAATRHLDAVLSALTLRGYVTTQGDKVSYQLPG